jgi:hypothetical protein
MATKSRSALKKPFTKQRFQCVTRKVRYRDHLEATEVLHRIKNKRRYELLDGGGSARNEIRSYACPHCRGYHSTSQSAPSATQEKGNLAS